MKKRVSMILVGGLLVCLMSGCGQNKNETVTVEPVAETVTENTEVAEGAEEEVAEADETDVDKAVTEDESQEVEEESEPETKEFLTITDEALAQDKSADYGVYSTSSFDLDQFLDENGETPKDWNWESKEHSEFSGRFAYPDITQCELMDSVMIYDRTDCSESLGTESTDGTSHYIVIYSGLDMYHDRKFFVGYDSGETVTTVMFTTQTSEGETEVLHETSPLQVFSGSVDEDGNPIDPDTQVYEYVDNQYIFNIGNFTVWVYENENELTEDEIQMIIDNISLKR